MPLKEGLDEVALEEIARGEAMVALEEVAMVPEVVEAALALPEVVALELGLVEVDAEPLSEVGGEGPDMLEGGWNEGLDAGERGQKADAQPRAGDAGVVVLAVSRTGPSRSALQRLSEVE